MVGEEFGRGGHACAVIRSGIVGPLRGDRVRPRLSAHRSLCQRHHDHFVLVIPVAFRRAGVVPAYWWWCDSNISPTGCG